MVAIYRDLSIAKKISIFLLVVALIGNAGFGVVAYVQTSETVEDMLGKRLEHIARTVSLQIDSKDHNAVLEAFLNQEKDIAKLPEFIRIQKVLREAQRANDLSSDIYTFISPEWAQDKMVFITMGHQEPYIGNAMDLSAGARVSLEKDRPYHTQLYHDEEGVWVSAFSPIRDKNGNSIATVEIDYRADKEVWEAKQEILWVLLGAGLFSFGICILFGVVLGRELARPIRRLAAATTAFGTGTTSISLDIESKDEIGKLALSFTEMVGEISRREKEMRHARDEAIRANKAKSQFLANMSHELRTPLNGIIGYVDLLKASEHNPTKTEQLEIVGRSGELLLSLVSDILDFSKAESGKVELENTEVHLKRLVEEVADVMASKVFGKNLDFSIYIDEKIPKYVFTDENRLKQVLMNLLGNAVKYTPAGEIGLKMFLQTFEDNKAKVRFEISDTGVGIPQAAIKKIFEPFEQSDVSDTRKFGGTGLGLTISRRIVELMNGDLSVDSDEGIGSTFHFTVELEAVADEFGYVEYSNRSFEDNICAQIFVESSTITKNLLRRLKSWDVRAESVNEINSVRGDVQFVIIDEFLLKPKLDQLRQISNSGGHIIVLSSPLEKAKLTKLYRDERFQFLSKPVKREELFNALARPSYEEVDLAEIFESMTSEPEAQELPPQDMSNNGDFPSILLVEDNLINQQVALAMLEANGYSADIADNGQIGVEMYKAGGYDLVLMDCQMPVMDGFDATEAIRNHHEDAIIVAMTANALKTTKTRCFEVGMRDFVTKPITKEKLDEVIKKNLRSLRAAS